MLYAYTIVFTLKILNMLFYIEIYFMGNNLYRSLSAKVSLNTKINLSIKIKFRGVSNEYIVY